MLNGFAPRIAKIKRDIKKRMKMPVKVKEKLKHENLNSLNFSLILRNKLYFTPSNQAHIIGDKN